MLEILKAVGIVFAVALILGLLLAISEQFLKVKEDQRIAHVASLLPQANCGGCGYPGCNGLAEALVNGECKKLSVCRPSKMEAKEAIQKYLAETEGPDGQTVKVDIN